MFYSNSDVHGNACDMNTKVDMHATVTVTSMGYACQSNIVHVT